MLVEEAPDINAFRAKVAGLKDTEVYSDPKVRNLLQRMISATR